MPLNSSNFVLNGHAVSADMLQFVQLLTGVMADQPVHIANTLLADGAITTTAGAVNLGSGPGASVVLSTPSGNLSFAVGGTVRWAIAPSGNMLAGADNSYDIGATAANRPRNIYMGTSINAPTVAANVHQIGNSFRNLTFSTPSGADIIVLENDTPAQGYVSSVASEACELWFNYSRFTNQPIVTTHPWGRLIVAGAYAAGGMFFETSADGTATFSTKFSVNALGNASVMGGSIFLGPGPSVNLVWQGGATLQVQNALSAVSSISTPTYFVGPSNTTYIQDAGGGIIRYMVSVRHSFENSAATGAMGDIWCRYVYLYDGSNGVINTQAGTLYLRSASGLVIMDGASGLNVSGNISGAAVSAAAGVWANGNILYFAAGGAYVTWNGYISTSHGIQVAGGAVLNSVTARGYPALTANTGQGDFVLGGGNSILYLHPNFTVGIQQNAPYCDIFGYAYVRAVSGSFVAGTGTMWFSTALNVSISWNGTYLNFSHSIQFNTVGNQIVWPNGSYISGNAGYAQGSKRKFKLAIESVDDDALLARVADPRLKVSTFEWPGDPRRNVGFMADDVARVLPEYALYDGDEPSGYSPQELTVLLWGAVRALNKKIEVLEGRA